MTTTLFLSYFRALESIWGMLCYKASFLGYEARFFLHWYIYYTLELAYFLKHSRYWGCKCSLIAWLTFQIIHAVRHDLSHVKYLRPVFIKALIFLQNFAVLGTRTWEDTWTPVSHD